MPTADGRATTVAGRETAHRFAQRVRAERRRTRRRWLAVAAVGLVLLSGVGLVARSSWLRVQKIVVSGAKRQPVDELVAAAAIRHDTPLWSFDPAAARKRVAALPRVRSATVTRSWPRTVRIHITERQPVAVVSPPTGGYVSVDSTAAEIERSATAPAGLLPVRLTPPALPDTPDARRPLVAAALSVAVALPAQVRARVAVVRVASTEQVELVLGDGALVHWGSVDRSERKAAVLSALLKTPHASYDVRAPETPSVR